MLAVMEDTGLAVQTYPTRFNPEPRRLRTVVIDDSASFLEVICALIERDDTVDVVARGRDGIEAIEIVGKLHPDLLLMDIDMPHLDGLNAAVVISRCYPETRIILMSSEETPELRADCRACGAAGFISKAHFHQEFPFLLEEIRVA
jgi:DNA-binding NarL/FixJ family response regulator